ncbi:MAG: hypothetical protein ACYCOU_06365 [Sulfobacillus sp.]
MTSHDGHRTRGSVVAKRPCVKATHFGLWDWSIGALEHWSIGALEHWSIWSIGASGHRDIVIS